MSHPYLDRVNLIVDKINSQAKSEGKLTGFCIGNTRKIDSNGLFFTPIRRTSRMIAGSVIVYREDEAIKIAQALDGKVNYILVDSEKKISASMWDQGSVGNIERVVRETVKVSRILTYKGNDLTVDALDCLAALVISSYPRGISGKTAAIIGAGNVGAKLALKLVERGMNVCMSRRDKRKLFSVVEALNIIKPPETIATITAAKDNLAAVNNADLVIGLSHGTAVITMNMVEIMADDGVLIDGGKGCCDSKAIQLAESRGIPIYRADIRSSFEGYISMALDMESRLQHSIGRAIVNGVPIVSGGLLARLNEVVVDSIVNPSTIFGISNGFGDFVRSPDPDQTLKLKTVENYLQNKQSL